MSEIITKYLIRWWHSPTLMTWGSFLTRSLSLVVVLPLILNRLNTAEISLWYVFSTVIGLPLLADLGFSPTFSRVISYGMGGLSTYDLKDLRHSRKKSCRTQANWQTIEKISSTMGAIYLGLTAVWISFLLIFGTWAVYKPISQIPDPRSGWIAWGVILVTSGFTTRLISAKASSNISRGICSKEERDTTASNSPVENSGK